jgi:molybdopterin converting factor small subunit
MKELDLQYIAHVTTVTGTLGETYRGDAGTLRTLVEELNERYEGFLTLFVSAETRGLNLNAMIYYSDPGEVPVAVLDLDRPIQDGATVTFW